MLYKEYDFYNIYKTESPGMQILSHRVQALF